MADVDALRQGLLNGPTDGSPAALTQERLQRLEDAIRRDERERTLTTVRHTLSTLRGLTAFLRQELEHSIEPLTKLCDDLEREAELALEVRAPEDVTPQQ